MKQQTVGVVGLGYVGLPVAAALASAGHHVRGFDQNPQVIRGLSQGLSHIQDVSSEDVTRIQAGGGQWTDDPKDLAGCDSFIICVPTPLGPGDIPDLSFVESAARTVGKALRKGNLVILESSTHPGTTDEVVGPILENASGLQFGIDFLLAYSPERIDPGNQQYTLTNTPKIVGGVDQPSSEATRVLYESAGIPVVVARGSREAELAKLLENTYRHVNIALVNELAILGRSLGIDVQDSIRCASSKPFGFETFYPGPGVGGHCIPVDPTYLSHHVRTKLGRPFRLIELAQEINLGMPSYVVERLRDELDKQGKALSTCRVLLVGISYKSDVADLRETPASDVVRNLREFGPAIEFLDPLISGWEVDGESVRQVDPDSAHGYDATVVLQHHSTVTPDVVLQTSDLILDTRAKMQGPKVAYL